MENNFNVNSIEIKDKNNEISNIKKLNQILLILIICIVFVLFQ